MQTFSPSTSPARAATSAPSGDHPADVARAFYAATFTLQRRVTRDMQQQLAALGLSVTQLKMLHQLAETGDALSVRTLGDAFSLSLAAASRAVDSLHQRGYVLRAECPGDRRVRTVTLTDDGRTALADLHKTNIAALTDFVATLTTAERRDLAAAIAPVLERLEVRASPEGPCR